MAAGWELSSGKFAVAARMLHLLSTETDERCVCLLQQCLNVCVGVVCVCVFACASNSNGVTVMQFSKHLLIRLFGPISHLPQDRDRVQLHSDLGPVCHTVP